MKLNIVIMVLLISLSSCNNTDKNAHEASSPTPLQAKDAILMLVKNKSHQAFKKLDPQKLAALAPDKTSRGDSWGPFELELKKNKYRFIIGQNRDNPSRVERFEYEGTFIYQNKKWTAETPEMVKHSTIPVQ